MTQIPERELTAHHEAGHAVAAVLRRGEIVSVDINGVEGSHLGETNSFGSTADRAFGFFAGPWAEARRRWPHEACDGEDGDGRLFADYVEDALKANPDDRMHYEHWRDSFAQPHKRGERDHETERRWHEELETEVEAIREVARRLIADNPPTTEEVQRMLVDPYGDFDEAG